MATARGSGTFVKEVELSTASFYLQDLKELFSDDAGTTIKVLEARFCPADERVARKLQIQPGERAIYIRRLLLRAGEPAFYHRGYLVNDPHRPVIEAELEVTDDVLFGDIWERPGVSKSDQSNLPSCGSKNDHGTRR